jgi:septum site-determining protein MinD
VHSYKGGTGKTLFSINLATIYAIRGNKVCLLDMDIRAPSLVSTFKNKKKHWINDYLNRICKIDQVLNDCTPSNIKSGQLFVGLANPSTEAIRKMSSKGRKWEMQALSGLIALKNQFNEKNQFDYMIIDTSSGLQYSSVNNIVVADMVLVITSVEKSDLDGTQRMIQDLYHVFEKKTRIIINKVPKAIFSKNTALRLEPLDFPIADFIPCSCDILKSRGDCIFALKNTEHPFTKKLQKIAVKIDQQFQ